MAEVQALDNGNSHGIVTVILAKDFALPEPYDSHPQVLPLNALELPQIRDDLDGKIPSQTQMVVIAGKIPDGTFTVLKRVLDRRNLTYVARNNEHALGDALRRLLAKKEHDPPPPLRAPIADTKVEEVQAKTGGNVVTMQRAAKGSLTTLLQEADLSLAAGAEARRLFRLAQQRGINTNVASLTTGISHLKRKGGRTATPKSLMSQQDQVLEILDQAIAGFQLVREYVAETEQKNLKLERRVKKLMAAMTDDDD